MLLALIYRLLYKVHHRFFLRPGVPLEHATLIVVGSFLVGGAGKTPFTIWLANRIVSLFQNKKVAVLCHAKAQDEFRLLQKKLPGVRVVATDNRYRSARELDQEFDYILCDDGFEDSRLRPAETIRLDWGEPPRGLRDLLPAGPCRSLPQDHEPSDVVLQCGGNSPDISFSISEIVNGLGECIENSGGKGRLSAAVAVCGVGNPERFLQDLTNFGVVVPTAILRPDHDSRFDEVVRKILKTSSCVIMTEKDAMRLGKDLQKSPFVYQCLQKVEVRPEVLEKIF